MSISVSEQIESLLRHHEIRFQVMRHEPVRTSEEAARVRGTPLASGAKALICKGDTRFVMFVVPADRRLDSHAVRHPRGGTAVDRVSSRLDSTLRQPVRSPHAVRQTIGRE